MCPGLLTLKCINVYRSKCDIWNRFFFSITLFALSNEHCESMRFALPQCAILFLISRAHNKVNFDDLFNLNKHIKWFIVEHSDYALWFYVQLHLYSVAIFLLIYVILLSIVWLCLNLFEKSNSCILIFKQDILQYANIKLVLVILLSFNALYHSIWRFFFQFIGDYVNIHWI